ncbi:gamma-glutamylcyclotransferase-like isoform X2 [Trichogramma pretiosum]|uniref:gamma-glutamylcyclotransferase-like isoform X2 n=1 Tax=Trichogramma pretiosum TaxID=7493 RepID=UPI000C71B363|nr:gamma-glutamylcyclotransferase-like isoform X2 [Trichogramma pretiosum]
MDRSKAIRIPTRGDQSSCVRDPSMPNTFLYFAYGSNMLTKRIHINNPTAVQKYIGVLKDHRLDFIYHSKRWRGCASTIVPSPGSEVWGIVWEIDVSNLPALDRQESVQDNVYFRKNVTIKTDAGENVDCYVYQQCVLPKEYVEPSSLPEDRQPSLIYLNTMINGAKEFNIPNEYIEFLKSFKNNGYNGTVDILSNN